MNNGWVFLHRKILDNPISRKPKYFSLWITILLLANHQDHNFIFNNKNRVIKRGQILTGRAKLAVMTGISEGTTETILNYLETQQQIQQQKTNKYRLITVLNYEQYQTIQQQKLQQTDNKLTTNQQQADTYKNDNKIYNKKENNLENFSKEIIKAFNDTFKKNFRVLPTTSYNNLTYWLTVYSKEEILQAIKNSIHDPFWKDKVEPVWFFRRSNPNKEPVDYIGKMLNIKPPQIQSSDEYWLQASNEKRASEGLPSLKSLYD